MKTQPTRILATALLALWVCFSLSAENRRVFSISIPQQSISKIELQDATRSGQQDNRQKPSRNEKTERMFDELLARTGKLRVIVGLSAGHQPEGALPSPQAIEQQRALIAQAQDAFLNQLATHTAGSVKRFETIPFIALEVDAAELERMRNRTEIVSIEEDELMKPSLSESTQIIGATAAWSRGFSGSGQTIAILDTGVDKTHSFLAGKVVSEACYSTNSADSSSLCPNGAPESTAVGSGVNCPPGVAGCDHGTHVAGIAAGRGSSFSGVARDANIIAVQVFSRFNSNAICGGSTTCVRTYYSDLIKGLERVHTLRNSFNIAAVNMSLGGGRHSSNCDAENPGMTAAINNLRSVGIAAVVASGNESYTNAISFPACISGAISVGSTDDGSVGTTLDAVSEFSNSAGFLSLLAPGRWINSSIPGNRFANFPGTSMAAPHVAGAFAVLKSSVPNAGVTQVLSALSSTGAPITDSRNGIAKPRIRLDAALDALGNSICTYSISPLSQGFPANGGGNSVNVTAPSNCSWQAVSNINWIVVNSGATGSGNGQVVYSVQANTSVNSRTGSLIVAGQSFTVTQASSGADPCAIRTPISIGQSPTGTLAIGDCQFPDGSYVDFYSFNASAGQQIAANLDSTAFDAFLALLGPDGNVIAYDDDGGGGTNSRIPAGTGVFTLPSTGAYLIAANSYRAGETGGYSLRLMGQSGCYRSYFVDATNNSLAQWLDTGLDVVSGQALSLTATGLACLIGQRCFDPNGEPSNDPFAEFQYGELVGKIGTNGQTLHIGANFQQNTPATGRLYLAVYDSFYPDNSGGFSVCLGGCFGTKFALPSLTGPNDGQTNVGSIVNVGGVNLARVTLSWALNASSVAGDSWLTIRDLSTNRLVFNQSLGSSQTQAIDLQPNSRYRWGIKAMPKSPANCASDEVFRTFTTAGAQCSGGNFICEQFNNSPAQATLNGVAIYDSANREARLTSTQLQQAGSLFFAPTTLIDRFTASFQIRIDGQGADGMTFAVIEGGANSLGRAGGSLGYENIPGRSFAIEFDNYYNEEHDPTTSPHLGLNVNGNMQSIATVGLPSFQGQGNLTVRVVVDRGTVEVFLPASHSAPALRATIPNWTPFTGRFGFTAATGGQSQIHVIDSVVIDVQSAPSCSYLINPTSQNFNAGANAGSFGLTTQSGCAWTVTGNASWIAITSGASGTGNGAVGYSITANNTGAQRIGTISVAGQEFTITQAACTFALNPTNQSVGAGAGAGVFSVTTQTGCAWTAVSNQAWLTVASSGSGSGSVTFAVAANPGAARTGTISVAGQTFTLTQAGAATTNRAVRAGQASGSPGGTVGLAVELFSLGDENALGFSLTFDPAVLGNPQATTGADTNGASLNTNNSQAAQGRFGVAVSLPSGQRFATGTRQVVNLSFSVAANAIAGSTPVGFGDLPIAREISDATANSLPANYVAGAIVIAQGYEADVAPRPNGNGSVTITDWVQVGRFVAGTDALNPGSEFQRADVAPRVTAGDGRLTVTDWVQAGRYAAGQDPLVPAGGPTTPASSATGEPSLAATVDGQTATRTLRIPQASLERGQNGMLIVELDTQGNENALGFSLSFDPTQLHFVSASLGNGAAGATLNLNANQADSGRLGIAIALPTGQVFAAGEHQILALTFTASANGNPASTTVNFLNHPVAREVSDVSANALVAAYADGAIQLTRTVTSVSAASFVGQSLASESIAAAFGNGLATGVAVASGLPLPTSLLGITVRVRDSAGIERAAPLFFVAPGQVNYQIPPGTALGVARITVTAADSLVSNGQVQITTVAPGLISANANGQGVVTALALRVKANGDQSIEPVARFDATTNTFVPIPLALGSDTDQVFLIAFCTGIRGRSSLGAASARLGGTEVPVLYAGAQGDFVGLDQINLGPIPRSLIGRGEIEIGVTVEGRAANVVRINIR